MVRWYELTTALEGNRGGHTKLTAVCSKDDLRRLIQPQEARSECL